MVSELLLRTVLFGTNSLSHIKVNLDTSRLQAEEYRALTWLNLVINS